MTSITVTAGPEFAAARRRLYAAGKVELEREYGKGIVKATRGAGPRIKSQTPAFLPVSGGYAGIISGALRVSTKASGGGVEITGRAGRRQIQNLEGGGLRAPSYGRRSRPWHNQSVRPGFFTKPITEMAPQIRAGIVNVMQDVADKIVGG